MSLRKLMAAAILAAVGSLVLATLIVMVATAWPVLLAIAFLVASVFGTVWALDVFGLLG
jgi:hypothetical protein